jgi:6,7-dimethyl-8-ribityllumazine synthase
MANVTHSNLLNIDAGILDTKDACVVLVRTEWNAAVNDELERGCRRILEQYKVPHIITITVPGAFEIPFGIRLYYESAMEEDDSLDFLSKPGWSDEISNGNGHAQDDRLMPDAFIALGCVMRGDTPHFDYVCKAVTDGVMQLNLTLPIPVVFGVLTVDNQQQADERIGGRHGHKGEEAAITALKMIALRQSLEK